MKDSTVVKVLFFAVKVPIYVTSLLHHSQTMLEGTNQRLRFVAFCLQRAKLIKGLNAVIDSHIPQQAHIIAYKWSNKFDVVVPLKRNSCLDYDAKTTEADIHLPCTSAFVSLRTKLDTRKFTT